LKVYAFVKNIEKKAHIDTLSCGAKKVPVFLKKDTLRGYATSRASEDPAERRIQTGSKPAPPILRSGGLNPAYRNRRGDFEVESGSLFKNDGSTEAGYKLGVPVKQHYINYLK
jgi:hypothetical protein